MMILPVRIDVCANIVFGVVVAAGLSMIVRPVTAELNNSLGTVWPFSTVHCDVRSTPGCGPGSTLAGGQLRVASR